jgi:hypothetical protein
MFLFVFIQCFSTDEEETLTTESLLDQLIDNLRNEQKLLNENWRKLKIDQKKLNEAKVLVKSNESTDVIQLNVGGELLMTTRHTLTRVPSSILAMLFNGRWEHKLGNDIQGNIFLDFNPILFRYLLDQLQTLETTNSPIFNPPLSPSLVTPFEKMLRKLGFISVSSSSLSLSNEIIALNVGGEQMITRRTTLARISQSNSTDMVLYFETNNKDNNGSVFIDHDPKLFRHLLQQLREETQTINHHLNTSLNETKDSFNAILHSFYLNRKCKTQYAHLIILKNSAEKSLQTQTNEHNFFL